MKKVDLFPIISFKNVAFSYDKKKTWVLKNVSFQLPKGHSLTIVGINGSGKSTMVKIISGLLLHFQGEVRILGKKLNEKNYQNIVQNIGLVFQNPESQFIGEDVEEDIAFGLENLNTSPHLIGEKIFKIAQRFKIGNLLEREPVHLSSGDKQKVAIASVLVTAPKIIIFDEPTSLLDQKAKQEILAIIDEIKKDKKTTVIEISHDIERIAQADLVMVVSLGEVVFYGTNQDLLVNHQDVLTNITGIKLPFVYKLSQALKQEKIINKVFLKEKTLLDVLWKLKK